MSAIGCPGCGRILEIPPELVGRWITCGHCQKGFAALLDEPEAADDAIEELLPPVSRIRAATPVLVLCSMIILVVLGIASFVVQSKTRAIRAQGQAESAMIRGDIHGRAIAELETGSWPMDAIFGSIITLAILIPFMIVIYFWAVRQCQARP